VTPALKPQAAGKCRATRTMTDKKGFMDIEAAIAATLQRMRTSIFHRGFNDCDAIMADYVMMLTGRDPMAAWRGRYHDDAGALAFIRAAGGNLQLVTRGMASIGILSRDGSPVRGDVVVIDYHGDEVTGLFLDPFTALKSKSGARQARFAKILKAFPCVLSRSG